MYLPFKQAIKLPFVVSNKLYFPKTSGKILFDCPIRTGLVHIRFGEVDIFDNKKSRSIWDIAGTAIFKGKADIGHGSKISVVESVTLILGENFTVTAESTIGNYSEVQYGHNCFLS